MVRAEIRRRQVIDPVSIKVTGTDRNGAVSDAEFRRIPERPLPVVQEDRNGARLSVHHGQVVVVVSVEIGRTDRIR